MLISKFKSKAILVLIGLLIFPSFLWAQEVNSGWAEKRVFYGRDLTLSLVPTGQYSSNKIPFFKVLLEDYERNTADVLGENFICNFNSEDKNLAQCFSATPVKINGIKQSVRESIFISKIDAFTPYFSSSTALDKNSPVFLATEYTIKYFSKHYEHSRIWKSALAQRYLYDDSIEMIVNGDVFFPKMKLIENASSAVVIPLVGDTKREWINIRLVPLSEKGIYKILLGVGSFKNLDRNNPDTSEIILSDKSFCSFVKESEKNGSIIGFCQTVDVHPTRKLLFSKFRIVTIKGKWEQEKWNQNSCVGQNIFVQVSGNFKVKALNGPKFAETIKRIKSVLSATNSTTTLGLLKGNIFNNFLVRDEAADPLACK